MAMPSSGGCAADPPRRQTSPSGPALSQAEKERVALEAILEEPRQQAHGSFLQELKRRGVAVTTSEAAELYHRVEPLVFGSAHAQVASAYGGAPPPVQPPAMGPAVAQAVTESRGSRSALTRDAVEGVEDPETGASLSELKTSFLSAMDPDAETLDEYEVRLSQGVEMARADCRDEALSFAEGMLGEAQFKTAYARFQKFATDAKSQSNGPDIVLRGIGAGISGLLQKPGADPVAIYYRYDGAVRAYKELGGADESGRVQARLQSLHEKAENALDARSLPPSSAASVRSSQDWLWENCGLVSPSRFRRGGADTPPAAGAAHRGRDMGRVLEEDVDRSRSSEQRRLTPPPQRSRHTPVQRAQHFDMASSSNPSGGETAEEMRNQREQDARDRAAELKSLRGEKSVFTFNLKDDLPIFGDGDTDLDRHLESFQEVCLVVKPNNDREKLRLFARTLKGTRRRCYDTIVKEAKSNGDYEARPNVVYDWVVAALDASFHESDEAKAMKARAKYDALDKKSTAFHFSGVPGFLARGPDRAQCCWGLQVPERPPLRLPAQDWVVPPRRGLARSAILAVEASPWGPTGVSRGGKLV